MRIFKTSRDIDKKYTILPLSKFIDSLKKKAYN